MSRSVVSQCFGFGADNIAILGKELEVARDSAVKLSPKCGRHFISSGNLFITDSRRELPWKFVE